MLLETQHGFYEVFLLKMNNNSKTKYCPKCKNNKPLSMFYKNSSKSSGYKSQCKICCKQYRDKNKDYFNKYSKIYREENLEYFKNKSKEFRDNNPEYYKKLKGSKEYKQKVNSYIKKKRQEDPIFKLKSLLRVRIYTLMLQNKYAKNRRTEEILGATYDRVRLHLESTFKEGMTWENNGRCKDGNCDEVWHIDHKIPLSSAKTEEDLYDLCHYTNLQALWGSDNLSKGGLTKN